MQAQFLLTSRDAQLDARAYWPGRIHSMPSLTRERDCALVRQGMKRRLSRVRTSSMRGKAKFVNALEHVPMMLKK